jgi:DNA-binding Lrp family transcriptional regulator
VQELNAAATPPLAEHEATLARLSYAFLLDEMANGVAGLSPLDALLVLAINQANIAPLTRDRTARARYGQLDAPAPDQERRPVSINAIAGSLGLPFETARRRIKGLAAAGVCAVSREGVVVPASFLASPAYLQSVLAGHERLRRFYVELKTAGLLEPLPAPNYGLEGSVPVRAAARLLSDYVLRASEGLMREAGNVTSTLLLVALVAGTLQDPGGGRVPSMRALVQMLRLPSETVRRHLAQLTDAGLCEHVRAGFVAPPQALAGPRFARLLVDNAANVQRLMSGLAERGVILAWDTGGALDGRQMA